MQGSGASRFYNRYIYTNGETQLEMMLTVQRDLKLWLCQYENYDFNTIKIDFGKDLFHNQSVDVEVIIDYAI